MYVENKLLRDPTVSCCVDLLFRYTHFVSQMEKLTGSSSKDLHHTLCCVYTHTHTRSSLFPHTTSLMNESSIIILCSNYSAIYNAKWHCFKYINSKIDWGKKVSLVFDHCSHRQITWKQELNLNPTVWEIPCVLPAAGAYWLLISVGDKTQEENMPQHIVAQKRH